MGGVTPTGFSSKRVSTGSGKNKSAVSFLVPIPEERRLVEKLFDTFLTTRSINATATALNQEHTTKNGAEFTPLAVRDILKNPIYCTADEQSYQYFMDQGANLFGEPENFDGVHGISAYNKTDQMILEDENSTFFNPKFVHAMERKPIEQWIVSVGQHDGYISSEKWINAQKLLLTIAERHNRPHRKTNALLSGILRCPLCGRPLRVVPESNRWTNGKPRFKYVCPGFRKKECTFKAVDGVEMDEFIVQKLADLSNERGQYGFHDMYSGGFYPYGTPEEHWAYWSRYIWINRYMDPPKPVYDDLLKLVQGKDYFVLTTNVDHCFQKAGFDKKRLFYTQGDYGLFQCSGPCRQETFENERIIKAMVERQRDMRVPSSLIPRCPHCGEPLTMNLRSDNRFAEDDGWHAAAHRYAEFLRRNKGMKVLLLELGVGYNTPGIIKYPFWEMAAQNPGAVYACLNLGQAACPAEISEQSICIDADIGSVLRAALKISLEKTHGLE